MRGYIIRDGYPQEKVAKKSKKDGRRNMPAIFTFQLFIYESLSIWYHYPIKRTRDVEVIKSSYIATSFLLFNLITIKSIG